MCKKENPVPGKIIAVTNRSLCERPFLEQIKRVCETKPAALILREKDLPETEYEELAKQVLEICEEYGVICILHSYLGAAKRLGRRYVHLPLPLLRTCMQKTENEEKQIKFMSGNLSMDQELKETEMLRGTGKKEESGNKNKLILGCSVHSVLDAIEAEKLGASYLTAGHIFATDCKRGLPPRGTDFLKQVCEAVSIPVYAIGGIGFDDGKIDRVCECGAAGACIMSAFMAI